jgi:hypothetical protein
LGDDVLCFLLVVSHGEKRKTTKIASDQNLKTLKKQRCDVLVSGTDWDFDPGRARTGTCKETDAQKQSLKR